MITITVGDIHGMAEKLDRLLHLVETWLLARYPGEPFRFVFLGDYVDRGPNSREVLDRIRWLQSEGAVVLRGNHEALMMAALNNDAMMKAFIRSGGDKTIASIQTIGAFLETTEWIEGLPLKFEDELRVFVHAGVRPEVHLADQTDDDLLWIREPFLNHPGPFQKYIVHGHSPTLFLPSPSRRPQVLPHRCNLDTGAVYGGPLSAAVFTDEQAAPVAVVTTEGSVLLRSQ